MNTNSPGKWSKIAMLPGEYVAYLLPYMLILVQSISATCLNGTDSTFFRLKCLVSINIVGR